MPGWMGTLDQVRPDGHGHRYSAEYVDGWNAVMRAVGMTSQDLAGLRKIISEVR